MTNDEFVARFAKLKQIFEDFLPHTLDILPPGRLRDAVAYALFGGGKRLRPVLCLAASRILSHEPVQVQHNAALYAASALEWMHTYSLVHDDLPALDNDDWRRGRATLHKLYDEATAILVGDALHAGAFVLASQARLSLQQLTTLTKILSQASLNMVQGQVVDTLPAARPAIMTPEALFAMIDGKTGAMMATSVEMGAVIGGATNTEVWRRYGLLLGRCFQMRDDQLDVSGTLQELGKTPGKDAAQSKCSAVAVFGIETEETLRQLHAETCQVANDLPWESDFFRHVVSLAVHRTK